MSAVIRKTLLVIAVIAFAIAPTVSAQLEGACRPRYLVRTGVGTAPYDETMRNRVPVMTFDDIFRLAKSYTRTKPPEIAAPKTRLGGFETRLIAVEGFVSCGGSGGRGGDLVLELQETVSSGAGRVIDFGYPEMSCRYGTPNAARLVDLDRRLEPWIGGGGSGCGFIDHFVRVIGYGYWTVQTDPKNPKKMIGVPNIFPALDVIVLDGPDGNEIAPRLAEDPDEDKHVDLSITTKRTVNKKTEVKTYRVTDRDGVWYSEPGPFLDRSTPTGTSLKIINNGVNPTNKKAGVLGLLFNVDAPGPKESGFIFMRPGTYAIGTSDHDPEHSVPAQLTIFDFNATLSCCTAGTVTISDLQWDCLPSRSYHTLHLVNAAATFSGSTSDMSMTGRLTYSAPPQTDCNSNNLTMWLPVESTARPALAPFLNDVQIMLPDSLQGDSLVLFDGGSADFPVAVFAREGITGDVKLFATTDEPGILDVTISPSRLPATGGVAKITVHTLPGATAGTEHRVTLRAIADTNLSSMSFMTTVMQAVDNR